MESKNIINFPEVKDQPIESVDTAARQYDRQNRVQQTTIEGYNKAIIMNDGTNDRLYIGFQEDIT